MKDFLHFQHITEDELDLEGQHERLRRGVTKDKFDVLVLVLVLTILRMEHVLDLPQLKAVILLHLFLELGEELEEGGGILEGEGGASEVLERVERELDGGVFGDGFIQLDKGAFLALGGRHKEFVKLDSRGRSHE